MKAIVYTAPRQIELLDVDEPRPADGEIVVDVRSTGICGSDLGGVAMPNGFRVPPLIMGHEFAGVRADTGQRVVVNPLISCGRCDRCLEGRTNLCRERSIIGIARPGAWTERVAVPEQNLHPIDEKLSWTAAALAEPFANALHAWRLADVKPGMRVAVIGAGTVGLTVLAVAKAHSVLAVDVADRSTERLETARRAGGSVTGAALEEGGEYDVVFDAVGSAATRAATVAALSPGGTAVWIGLHDDGSGFEALDAVRQEKRIQCCFCYTDRDFRAAVDLVHMLEPEWVTTASLNDGVSLFYELMEGRTDIVKVQLAP
jgi:2-desacetyl-2-hydroxyethyl bacteriochlorophyllide A dehydrogenase